MAFTANRGSLRSAIGTQFRDRCRVVTKFAQHGLGVFTELGRTLARQSLAAELDRVWTHRQKEVRYLHVRIHVMLEDERNDR